MKKQDIKKIEELIEEIIVSLEEDWPDDKSEWLCARSPMSPFRQLIGMLRMEQVATRIICSEEPLVIEIEAEETTPIQLAPREPIIQKPSHPIVRSAVHKTGMQISDNSDSLFFKHSKTVMIVGSILTAFISGYFIANYSQMPSTEKAKITVNWTDIERGKTNTERLSNDVPVGHKKSARSFFNMGKSELNKSSLATAREYFRTAVSLDPSNQEFIEAFRLAESSNRKKPGTRTKGP